MNIIQILNEGKKERLIDKFRSQLEPLGDEVLQVAEQIVDNDPSVTKKYSEWAIKKFIEMLQNPSSNLQGRPPITLASLLWVKLKYYHNIVDKLSPEKVSKIIDTVGVDGDFSSDRTEEKIRIRPKDITSFDTYEDLSILVSYYDDYLESIETEKDIKKDADKIYEDDRFLIVRPLSHKTSCYYGANTQWCTTTSDDEDYFNKYTSRGKLYYIIDKKSQDVKYSKMALLVPFKTGSLEIYNQQDGLESYNFLLERFEPIKEQIKKLTNKDDDYKILKKVRSNPKIGMYESLSSHFFDEFDGEDVIFNFSNQLKNYLDFMEDEVGEEAIGYYIWAYENPNGNFFYEFSSFDDDMNEGYPLHTLTPEHVDILRAIVEILEPELLDVFNGSEIKHKGDWDIKLANFIKNKLPKLYENFGYLYSDAEDKSIHEGVIVYIEDKICNLYNKIGLIKVNDDCFGRYKISIDRLLDIYEINLDYNKELSVEQVLENIIQQEIDLDGYFIDSVNEYQDTDVFYELFNEKMTNLLDNTLYELESNTDVVTDASEYKRILNYISKKFGLNQPYPIKTAEDETQIIFTGVNPKNSKINFDLVKPDGERKKGSAKLTTIIKLLSNYTLFDPF